MAFTQTAGTMLLKDYPGPRGAPTITYVAVSPQERYADPKARDVLMVDKHTLLVEDRQRVEHRYQMEEVFANMGDDDVIYETMLDTMASGLAPLRALVKNSVSTCVLVMGSTSSRKKMIYQGDGRADSDLDGVIGWGANKLFEMLDDEQNDPDFRGAVVAASFVEIFDETLIDLLNLEAKGLHLMMDPRDGYQVTPLDKVEVKNYDDVMRVLEHGIKNRNTKRFQDGTAADFSSAVFEFHVMQQRVLRMDGDEDPNGTNGPNGPTGRFGQTRSLASTVFKTHMADGDEDPVETLISRLVFVEVPCTDDLIESPLELRARHGPYLHRSLLTFVDVCKAMADETMQYYAPFTQSRLTHILQDIFGGNFLVLCLACIAPGEPEITLKTLDLVSTLGKAAHFPNENHEMLQGLLMKYRTELGHLQDKALERDLVEADKRGLAAEVSEEMESVRRRLQEELSQALKERNVAKEDALKIYKVLELLKAKYNTLLEEKAKQSKELIEAEEAKLKIARSLLELKLEISKLQEDFEREKYDLSSQLLAAKNEACELEIKLQDAQDIATKKKEEAEQLKRERDDLQVELSTLHSNFSSLRAKYNDEKSKTVELGAELLSLVNAHDAQGKAKSELETRVHQQGQRLNELQAALDKANADLERLAALQREQTRELDELRAEKIKAQLELERATLAFETSRLQIDKSTADFLRDKDLELMQTRRNAEEQLRKLTIANEELERKCQALEGQVRRENRKVQDLNDDLNRAEEEIRGLKRERDQLEAELEAMTRKYRRKVVVLLDRDMGQIASIAKPSADNGPRNSFVRKGPELDQPAGHGKGRVSSAFVAMANGQQMPPPLTPSSPAPPSVSSPGGGNMNMGGMAMNLNINVNSPSRGGGPSEGPTKNANAGAASVNASMQQQQQQQGGKGGMMSQQQQVRAGVGASRGGRLSIALAAGQNSGPTQAESNASGAGSPKAAGNGAGAGASPMRSAGAAAGGMSEKGAGQAGGRGGDGKDPMMDEELEYKERRALLEDLLESYRQRETALTALMHSLRNQNNVLNVKNKGLFVKCRKLLHLLEDSAPQALQEANITLTKEEDTDLERVLKEEAESLRRRLLETDKELAVQQDKNIQLAELYLQALRRLEGERAQWGRYGQARMSVDVRSQHNSSDSLAPMAPPPFGDDAAQLTLLQQENDHLRRQLKHARVGGPGPTGAVGSCGPVAVSHQGHHHHVIHSPPRGAKCRCNPGCKCTCKAAVGRVGDFVLPANASAAVAGSGGAAASALMAQLQEAEKRYASLMSKCAMLEEESSSYKRHMNGVVGRYQTELRRNRGPGRSNNDAEGPEV